MATAVTYREPATRVTIIEEATSATAPPGKLLPVQVGPGFQIELQKAAGAYGNTASTAYSYVDQLAESTIKVDTVIVYITNTIDGVTYEIPETLDGTPFWVATADSVTLQDDIYGIISYDEDSGEIVTTGDDADATRFFTGVSLTDVDVYAGDVLYINTAGVYAGAHIVAGKDGNNLIMQTNWTGAGDVDLDWEIRRYLVGEVYITYHALRGDLVENRTWLNDTAEVIIAAGGTDAIIPDNPLFYAAWLATSSGGGTYICGVDDAVGAFDYEDDDNILEWAAAFAYLQDFEDMYSYVILTQIDEVIALANTFVNWMSLPDNRAEGVAFCSPHRTSEEVAITEDETTQGVFVADGSTFTDTGIADFEIYSPKQTGYVEITYDGTVSQIRAQSVIGGTITILDPTEVPDDICAGGVDEGDFTYRFVNDYYDSNEEAGFYRAYAQSYLNKRMRLVFPNSIGVSVSGDIEVVPSYYWWSYRSGLIYTNTNPSTPYTNTSAQIFARAYLPFRKKTYLNKVADGGWEIIMQDAPNLPMYCRHQLTTDMTHPARSEQSVVHAVDHCAKYVRIVLDPNIGRYNGSSAYISMIKTLLSGVKNQLVNKVKSLASFTTLSVVFDGDDPRTLNVEIRAGALYPVNNMDIILLVS